MEKYIICIDASADIDENIFEKEGIQFIPMEYSFNNEMRTSKGIEDAKLLKDFYDGQRNGDLTKTSQITPFMYEEFFEKYLKEGYSILYLALSSGLSSTYSSSLMAINSLKETYNDLNILSVDSLSATGGLGILTERAARNKNKGMSIKDNYEDLIKTTHKIKHWFLVQDLNYLKRGGRVSPTTAFVGSMLNIKPILKIDELGKLVTISKKRGTKGASLELLRLFENSFDENMDDVIYIIDADEKSIADNLVTQIKTKYPSLTIRRKTLCPIIGAHTGPGMVAICHMGK